MKITIGLGVLIAVFFFLHMSIGSIAHVVYGFSGIEIVYSFPYFLLTAIILLIVIITRALMVKKGD